MSWNNALHETKIQSPQDFFANLTNMAEFHCFVHEYGRLEVMWKRSDKSFFFGTKVIFFVWEKSSVPTGFFQYKFMAAVSLSLANVTSFENDPVNNNHKGFLCWMLSADGASLGLGMSKLPKSTYWVQAWTFYQCNRFPFRFVEKILWRLSITVSIVCKSQST